MVSSSPVQEIFGKLFSFSKDELSVLNDWWKTEQKPEEDIVSFLVRQKIFSEAAPILMDLMEDGSLSSETARRLFSKGGTFLLLSKIRPTTVSSRSEKQQQHDISLSVLGLFESHPEISKEGAAQIQTWWQTEANTGEDLVPFLVRQQVFSEASVVTLELLQEIPGATPDLNRLIRSGGIGRLLEALAALPAPADSSAHAEATAPAASQQPALQDPPRDLPSGAAFSPVENRDPQSLNGITLGQYQLQEWLKQEGAVAVYRATDKAFGRRVIVSVLAPEWVDHNSDVIEVFLEQARLQARLDHSNCLAIHAIGQENNLAYAAQPMLTGETLEAAQHAQNTFSIREATRIAKQIARGLQAAHEVRISHGQLHPCHIILMQNGDVKIADFRIDNANIIPFLASESVEEDRRRDIFRLGVLYCWMLSSGRSLTSSEQVSVQNAVADSSPANQQTTVIIPTSIPDECVALIERATQPDADRPYSAVEEFLQDLEEVEMALSGADINLSTLSRSPTAHDIHLTDPSSHLPQSRKRNEKPSLSVGSMLGKCLLMEKIGQGASGTVFRALHKSLNIPVAIKVLNTDLLHNKEANFELFQKEAQLLARLNHPNIVRVWDFEEEPEFPYLVLEFVEGLSLSELIAQSGRLQVQRGLSIFKEVVQGLRAAHQLGIVHRDLKPGNILLTREGTAKVADLGLAVVVQGALLDNAKDKKESEGMAGTAAYMSPEQAFSPTSVDHRSDIYSLGSTLYHMLVGQLPFNGRNPREVIFKRAKEMPKPVHEVATDLSMGVSELISRMMAKEQADRFQTYDELLEAIDASQENTKPTSAKKKSQKASIWEYLFPNWGGKKGSGSVTETPGHDK